MFIVQLRRLGISKGVSGRTGGKPVNIGNRYPHTHKLKELLLSQLRPHYRPVEM